MDKYIKVGIGVMILDGNKILLGHRAKDNLPEKLYSPSRKFIERYLKLRK